MPGRGPVQSVNEVDPGGMVGTVWLEERLWTVEVNLLHPRRRGGGGCLLVLTRLCCVLGIVCGLPVVSRNFLENGPPWGTGWRCGRVPLPVYWVCTLPALALQRTWLNESGWLSFTSFMWFTRSFVLSRYCYLLTICSIASSLRWTSLGYLTYQVEGGVTRGSHTCKNFAGRMWSGAREHYVSEISNRRLPWTKVQ